MKNPEVDTVLRSWLIRKAPTVAPPTLLERVRAGRTEVRQRRWLAYVPSWRLPSGSLMVPSGAAVAAVVVVLATVSVGLSLIGRPSDRAGVVGATPTDVASPATATDSSRVTIEFLIERNGVLDADPSRPAMGAGTFVMTGALGNQGTFSDLVSVTPEGVYRIERTLEGGHGTMVLVASATTLIDGSFPTSVSGTWQLVDGGPAYPGVVASGTVSGAYDGRPHERWVGEVRR